MMDNLGTNEINIKGQKIPKVKLFLICCSIPETLGERSYQPESTKMASPFIIPDFIISTTYARVAYIAADSTIAEVLILNIN